MNYTQFRLTNGDEIVAQVIEEPEGEDFYIVVKNAMMIIRSENHIEGYRYYSFRPWMAFQQSESYYQLLNYNHIIGEAKPDETLLSQYYKAVVSERDNYIEGPSMSSEAIEEALKKLHEYYTDSDNVIPLFDKDKLH